MNTTIRFSFHRIAFLLVLLCTTTLWGVAQDQRPLEPDVDYILSDDGKSLIRWFAEDITSLNMNQDPTLAKVEVIGEFCFFMNTVLTEVILSDQLKEIKRGAFDGSTLKKVYISKSVKTIGKTGEGLFNPFGECISLTDIEVAPDNRRFIVSDGYLLSKDGSTLISYAMGRKDAALTLPEGVTTIGGHAFAGALFIKSIVLPSSVKRIDRNAFLEVGLLKDITLNEGLEQIDFGAFMRTAIEEIELPSTFTFCRDGVAYVSPFLQCESLKTIRVSPKNKDLIVGKDGGIYSADKKILYALPAANGITEYTAPATLHDIAQGAFSYHKTLTTVYIAPAVDYLPLRAFEGCSKLRSVTLATSCPWLSYQCFQDCMAIEELHCLGRGVVTLQDMDVLNGVNLSQVTLYVAPEEKDNYANHPLQGEIKIETGTPQYRYIQVMKDEQKPLEGITASDVIYNHYTDVAHLTENKQQIQGGIQGYTSLISESGTPLYLIEVTPTVTTISEPLFTSEAADEETVALYEKKVAKRLETKREPQFGGVLVSYADPEMPGVEAKYLFFDGLAASYVSLVFEGEEQYNKLQGNQFFAERYAPAKGTDIDGESFDGYARLSRLGYELHKLSIDETAEQAVVQINYFKIQDLEYKSPNAIEPIRLAPQKVSMKQVGSQIEFSHSGVYHISLYTIDGSLLVEETITGSEYTLPKQFQRGVLVIHTESGATQALPFFL